MKRMEVDIGIGYEVALMIRFIQEYGLWAQYQEFKEKELPWAEKEVHELFTRKGWLNES